MTPKLPVSWYTHITCQSYKQAGNRYFCKRILWNWNSKSADFKTGGLSLWVWPDYMGLKFGSRGQTEMVINSGMRKSWRTSLLPVWRWRGLYGCECERPLVAESSTQADNVETGPNSGHHKELNSVNHLNEVGSWASADTVAQPTPWFQQCETLSRESSQLCPALS